MNQINKKKPHGEESARSLSLVEEAIDETLRASKGGRKDAGPINTGTLVATVISAEDSDITGQVLVSWDEDKANAHRVGFVRGLALREGDNVLLTKPNNWPKWLVTNVLAGANGIDAPGVLQIDSREEKMEAVVDGKRVEITGEDEIVFKCGKSSITLRRNGRVLIRGTYVETKSKGTNRIKGGSVLIN